MREERVVYLVARIVEPDEAQRERLIESVETRRAIGEDPATEEDGFNWRAWAIDFARENPRLVMLAPVSVACYLYLIAEAIARFLGV